MSDTTTVKVDGLEKLIKALKVNAPKIRVGILGSGTRPNDGGLSNAQVGLWHEFGTSKLPPRSFLRIPLTDRLNQKMKDSGLLTKKTLDDVIKQGSLLPWAKQVAVCAEAVVLEAFDTGGYGKWAPHAPGYTNNTGMILVDTTQLRDSITSEVKT